jgi:6,7-dimethyl-8-ribityllumazine synthase
LLDSKVKSRAVPVAEVRDCVDAGEAGWLDDVVRLPSRLGAPGLVATDLASASKSTSGVTATAFVVTGETLASLR